MADTLLTRFTMSFTADGDAVAPDTGDMSDLFTESLKKCVSVGTASFETVLDVATDGIADIGQLVVVNTDPTNFIDVSYQEAAKEYVRRIPAGRFDVLYSKTCDIDSTSATGHAPTGTLVKIQAQANTAAVKVKVYAFT